jgi:Flp pilus assembly protein TadD/tRNA A-37 threonylcarbamoyl transferase component Bud32
MVLSISPHRTLAEQLRAGPLQPGLAFSIAVQVGRELAAAHAAGKTHGNLTSAFVELGTEAGVLCARINGFGAASPTSDDSTAIAPALRTGQPATVSDDICGFGGILTDLSAAVPPPGLGTRWDEAARRCRQPVPALRFGTIGEVLDALQIPPHAEETCSLPPAGPASTEPRRWGDFQLLQRLGQGAFGEVWRAWDPVLEREVALKLLLPRGLNPEQEFASIVAEARAMARVRHPNIVPVYGVDRRQDRVGFWSDFIRGRTLSQYVRAEGALAAGETMAIGSALCQALSALHHAGLLHRDIKASNAMIDEDGRVLLMDFGLSQDLRIAADVAGTPNYMAPEVRAGDPQTVCSDIYAMGVLLLFLATGTYPLSAPAPAAPPDWKLTGDDLSIASLRAIVATATHSDPRQRFPSAAAMNRSLITALEEKSTSGAAALSPQPRRAAPWVGAILGVAVLSALFFVFVVPRLRPAATGEPAAGSPAYQDYLAAEAAFDRYDKPGNTQKAIDLYQKTLQRAPDFALAEAGLARADWRLYLDTSDPKWAKEATQAAARADEINPGLAPVQMTLGAIHVDQGQFGLGMQELEKAESLDPHNADVHATLAEAYRQQGRLADAKNEYQAAIDLAPDAWRWPYLLGAMQIDSGDYPGAEASLQSALQKTPDNARVLYDLGLAYRKQGRFTEARSAYEKAIAIDPRSDTIMALGLVMLLQGDQANAVRQYRRAVALDPNDWNTWGNLAAALSWQGIDTPESNLAYEKAITLGLAQLRNTPDDSYVLSMLGNYCAALHRPAKALPFVRKSLALAPSDPDVQELAAESYEMLGHREEALEHLSKALQLGFSVDYVRTYPIFRALRSDPHAPKQIQD